MKGSKFNIMYEVAHDVHTLNPGLDFVYQLIRYTPDQVRGEFVNIGVLLRWDRSEQDVEQGVELRMTKDWSRVKSRYPDADMDLLTYMESDLRKLFRNDRDRVTEVLSSLSLLIQLTEPRGFCAESPAAAMDHLMRLYVD